jgi:hypothetical protein
MRKWIEGYFKVTLKLRELAEDPSWSFVSLDLFSIALEGEALV